MKAAQQPQRSLRCIRGYDSAMRTTTAPIRDWVILITGGSRGLGLAIAEECLRRGAIPVLCARDAAELDRASTILTKRGTRFGSIASDAREESGARRAVEFAVDRYGRIDAVINNAGIITVGPQSTMARSDYEDALATHFWGPYNVVQAALPHLRRSRGKRIVNVSSIGGRISVPHLLPYSVSKFALSGYSEGLRSELARENIAVTTVYPGLMRTGSPRNARFAGKAWAEYAWFKLSDTLPGISVSASFAAREIVDAMARGDATLTISALAKLGSFVHGIAPALTARALSLACALLPSAPGKTGAPRRGAEAETPLTRSPLTALGARPERTLNQRREPT